MSKSKLMIGVMGLVILLTPIQVSPSQIVDEFMETAIETRTEENNNITNEVKLQGTDFISVHSEFIEEVEEEEWIEVNCELTFYTSLASCNGSNVGKNAIDGYLSETSIAIPRKSMPFGTKIDIGDYGVRYADDVGNPKYIRIKEDGTYVFDVYVPRLKGESDKKYRLRILDMGRVKTTAKVYIEEG